MAEGMPCPGACAHPPWGGPPAPAKGANPALPGGIEPDGPIGAPSHPYIGCSGPPPPWPGGGAPGWPCGAEARDDQLDHLPGTGPPPPLPPGPVGPGPRGNGYAIAACAAARAGEMGRRVAGYPTVLQYNTARASSRRAGAMFKFLYEGKLGELVAPLQSDEGALQDAVATGKVARFDELVSKGVSPTTKTRNGSTLMHVACHNGRLDMAECILQLGACRGGGAAASALALTRCRHCAPRRARGRNRRSRQRRQHAPALRRPQREHGACTIRPGCVGVAGSWTAPQRGPSGPLRAASRARRRKSDSTRPGSAPDAPRPRIPAANGASAERKNNQGKTAYDLCGNPAASQVILSYVFPTQQPGAVATQPGPGPAAQPAPPSPGVVRDASGASRPMAFREQLGAGTGGVQPDGFVSSAANPHLAARYGNVAASSAVAAPPPTGGPPVQSVTQMAANNPYARGRYVAYDAHTESAGSALVPTNAPPAAMQPPGAPQQQQQQWQGAPMMRPPTSPSAAAPAIGTGFAPPPPGSRGQAVTQAPPTGVAAAGPIAQQPGPATGAAHPFGSARSGAAGAGSVQPAAAAPEEASFVGHALDASASQHAAVSDE